MATLTSPPPSDTAIPYLRPQSWIIYDQTTVFRELVETKAAVLALKAIPHRRDWVERLQEIQLKMEVAGTSRIEGADFTENELETALSPTTSTEELITRSQRQARAAVNTYRWIATIPSDRLITVDLIKEVHAGMIQGCDDDHCPPGVLRGRDYNVTFGLPRHRGCDGGAECESSMADLVRAINQEFRDHDPLVQALAFHYHFAAMHPFLDGNGRTARALEALLLQRAGLRDTAFIAMSNYYYEEKPQYLSVLARVRAARHDLTPFLVFALRGVRNQCERLSYEITLNVKRAVFRNMMFDLFPRLETPRKRVIAQRQIGILKILLDGETRITDVYGKLSDTYEQMKAPVPAFIRDVSALIHLGAVTATSTERSRPVLLTVNLDWPQQITETDFMRRVKDLPKAKDHEFMSFT